MSGEVLVRPIVFPPRIAITQPKARPTQAQARAAVIAKAAILDFATGLSAEEAAAAIADALLATHGPDVVEAIGDRISRAAHLAGRV